MPATSKAIIRTDKQKTDGTCPVYVRITLNRKTRQLATGVAVEPKDWNGNKGKVRGGHDLADAYNARIASMLNDARKIGLNASSAREISTGMKRGNSSLLADVEEFIQEFDKRGKYWEAKHFRVLSNKLTRCFGENLNWTSMDSVALTEFEQFLREVDGNSSNTIRNHMKRLNRLFRSGARKGVLRIDDDPFKAYSRPKATPPQRRKLSREEVAAIEGQNYEFGTPKSIARDAFLFSLYGSGIRFGDLCALKPANLQEGYLVYRMMKTGSPVRLKLPEKGIMIAQKYADRGAHFLFSFLDKAHDEDPSTLRRMISSRNVMANRNLKEVARDAGIRPEGLTMHIARHTFADFARTSSGNLHAISNALGHSDLRITEAYLKSFDQDAVNDLVDSVFG